MKKYRCCVCDWLYDPEKGDPENQIQQGTPFEALPDGWICPVCGEKKFAFSPEPPSNPLPQTRKEPKTLIKMSTEKLSKIQPAELPYPRTALAPVMSEETLNFHYGKHYMAYVNKVNELILDTACADKSLEELVLTAEGAVYNNAAQAWNHQFFFEQFSENPQKEPTGELLEVIKRDFGSERLLKQQILQAAGTLFGSGWVWLAEDSKKHLVILKEGNAGNPMTRGLKPILCMDVWEHAYYLDYQNRRPDAVGAWWDILDWKKIEARF